MSTSLEFLRAHVPTCLACLRTHMPQSTVRAYVLRCQRVLRALILWYQRGLRAHVLTFNMHGVPYLTRLPWPCDHLQKFFASSFSSFGVIFFSFTALLLKLYTLLVRFKSFINVFMNSYIIQLYYLYVGLNKGNIREALVIYWDVLVS